jgi:hypothetical protein
VVESQTGASAGRPRAAKQVIAEAEGLARRLPAAVRLALLLVHLLAYSYALRTGRYVFPDTDRYVQAAYNLAHYGQLYARPLPAGPLAPAQVQELTIRPPGYPLLVLALGAASGQVAWLLLLQNALSYWVLAAVLRGWAAARARPPGVGAWTLALLLTLSFPAQLIYANAVMSEVPLQALLWLGAGLAVRAATTGCASWLAGAGAVLVAAFVLKPVLYPFVGVFALGAAGLAWRYRRAALLALGLLPALAAATYVGWNAQRTGYAQFSSISTINLLHYNAAGVLRQAEGATAENAWTAAVLRRAAAAPTFAARQQQLQAAAWAVLRRYPLRYAGQHLLGMVAFFLDPGRFDLNYFLGPVAVPGLLDALRNGGATGLLGALGRQPPALLALLLLVALANGTRLLLAARYLRQPTQLQAAAGDWLQLDTRAGCLVVLGLLLYLALLTGPLGAARFLVPGYPLLLALALRGL